MVGRIVAVPVSADDVTNTVGCGVRQRTEPQRTSCLSGIDLGQFRVTARGRAPGLQDEAIVSEEPNECCDVGGTPGARV